MESRSVTRECPGGPRAAPAGRRARGFTLIELLVLLVIVGITVTLAVLSVNINQSHQLREDAKRLTALIQLAHEEAILEAREIAVQLDDGGYRFFTLDDAGKWVPWEKDGPLKAHTLPKGYKVDVNIEGQKAQDEQQLGGKKAPPALVYILSSGEITPFELTMSNQDGEAYRITGKLNGDVKWEKASAPGGER